MKKKKLLLSGLLGMAALAAGLSLASCDMSLAPSYKDNTKVVTTTTTKAPTTTTTKTPAKTTTTTKVPTTTKTPATTTTTGTSRTTTTTTTTTTTIIPVAVYNVTFDANGHGVAPEAIKGVTKLPTALPEMENQGRYKFIGWTATASGTEAVTPGSAIQADTTLYAMWEEMSLYEFIANSDYKIYNTDFGMETVNNDSDYQFGYKGIYSLSPQTDNLKVEVKNGKLSLTDTDNAKPAKAMIRFGILYEGVIEGTMKINFSAPSTVSKQDFVSFHGYSSFTQTDKDGNSTDKLFALRTNASQKLAILTIGKDETNDSEYIGTPMTWEVGKEYEIYYKYDFDTHKLTLTVSGTVIVEDYELPKEACPMFLIGEGFMTAGSKVDRSVTVDEFAISNDNIGSLDDVKKKFCDKVEELFSEFDLTLYTKNQALMTQTKNTIKANINSATTKDDSLKAFLEFSMMYYAQSDEQIAQELQEYKEQKLEELDNEKNAYKDDYKINATDFDKLYDDTVAAINAATSKDEVDDAYALFDLNTIVSDYEIRDKANDEYKLYYQEKCEALSNIQGISQKDLEEAAGLLETKFIEDGNIINNCDALDIDEALQDGKDDLDAIVLAYSKTLADVKTELEQSLSEYKTFVLGTRTDQQLITDLGNITLDWTNVTSRTLAMTEYENKCNLVDETIREYDLKVEKDYYKNLLTIDAMAKYATLSDSEAITYFETKCGNLLDGIETAPTVGDVEPAYDEAMETLETEYNNALQIELDNREDVEVSAFVKTTYKADFADEVKSLSSNKSISEETTFAGVFKISAGVLKANDKCWSSNKLATTITFTTVSSSAKLTINLISNTTGRKIIVDGVEHDHADIKKNNDYVIQLTGTSHTITFNKDEESKVSYFALEDDKAAMVSAELNSVTATFNSEYVAGSSLTTLLNEVTGEAYYDSNNDGKIDNNDEKKSLTLNKELCTVKLKDSQKNDVTVLTTSGKYTVTVTYCTHTTFAATKYNTFEKEIDITVVEPSKTFDEDITINFNDGEDENNFRSLSKLDLTNFTVGDGQLKPDTVGFTGSLSFKVKAGTLITINGYSDGYVNYTVNDVKVNSKRIIYVTQNMVDVNNEYTVNIVTGSSMSYLKTIEIDVDGVEPEPEVTTSIAISGQTTSFDNGATFDKGSLVVLATSSLGVISDVTDLAEVTFESGVLDSNNKFTVTDQIVEATVKYGNFTKTYDVTVGTVQTAISTDTALVFTNKNYIDTVTNKIDFGVVAGSKGGFTVSGTNFGNPSYLEFKNDDKIEFNLEVPTGKKAILTVSYYYNKEGVVTLDAKPITGNFNSTSGENNLYDYELKTSGSVVLAATTDQNFLNYIVVKFVDSEYTVKFNANGGKFDTVDYVDVTTVSGIVTAPTTDPTKDNSTFKGWFTSTDGGTTLSDTAFDFATPVTGALTLYAKWEEKQDLEFDPISITWAAANTSYVAANSSLIVEKYVKFVSGSKAFEVDGNGKSYNNVSYTYRMKTGGNAGSIEIDLTSLTSGVSMNLELVFMSSKKGNTRTVTVTNSTTSTTVGTKGNDGNNLDGQSFVLSTGNKYVITWDNAVNFYGIYLTKSNN